MRTRSSRVRQHELDFRPWGGARRGAGRKRIAPRPRVSHRSRPRHAVGHPLHITVRLRAGLPTLRQKRALDAIVRAFAAGRERFGFRLTRFSVQSNHLHLLAEADDLHALSLGMQGLLTRVARALNALWSRRGAVFADRFHARALRTPREVRAALVYVLHNARHHGVQLRGVDPYSSGPWFDGWKQAPSRMDRVAATATARAKTWLLRKGWLRHGPIGVEESPRSFPRIPERRSRSTSSVRSATRAQTRTLDGTTTSSTSRVNARGRSRRP
jgi:REP-associated tyrosine transposase